MKKSSRGFTLIELLVVIAIIGILSSVVLASLTSARSKGTDAAIQSELANMRAQAELYYSSSGANSYGPVVAAGACPTSSSTTGNMFSTTTTGGLWSLVSDLETKAFGGATKAHCQSTGTAWAVTASTTNGQTWCVDSAGNSKQGSQTAAVCN
ncbi:MAG: type II secretion system protein [Patescibacteria group bacterium]